jgi:hypothetical protein
MNGWHETEDERERAARIERNRIIEEIERNICFDAQADVDGRCSHHGGKCYELRQLIVKLQTEQ